MPSIKKIVILGPESTGKSSLCEQLSIHYRSAWVPEYARTYLHDHGMSYQYDDLLTIARGQLLLEDTYFREFSNTIRPEVLHPQPHPLFIDTNMYVMKVWSEFVFDRCHDWILQQIATRDYDLYFLCNIDLPWVKDELREYPDLQSRQRLYLMYKDILINQPVPWVEIEGDYDRRFEAAVSAVDDLLAAR